MPNSGMKIYEEAYFRRDLQGLRVAAALNIAIYHIWIQKVSGGVDVFFVVSGLLLTASLLRAYATGQNLIPIKFWWRVVCRIMPSAIFVIILTTLASLYFIPAPLWKFGLNEMIASLLNVENLELIRRSADYLDRESPPSQFQQFWALGVQFQYYLFLPFIAWFAVHLGKYFGIKGIIATFLALAALGFFCAVAAVQDDPTRAYFSPLARVWQFAVGGALGAAYPLLRSWDSGRPGALLYALGFLAVIGSGALFPPNAAFPGWPALAPVLGVCVMVFFGAGEARSASPGLRQFLASPALVFLSKLSFGFYLWHWPLLIFAYHQTDTTEISVLGGIGIILLAALLSALTYALVERHSAAISGRRKWAIAFLSIYAAVTVAAIGARQYLIYLGGQPRPVQSASQPYSVNGSEPLDFDLSYWASIDYDRSSGGTRCRGQTCVYNEAASGPTYLLYGSSHAAQWTDVIIELAKRNNARLVTASALQDYRSEIMRLKPDVVITLGSETSEVTSGERERASADQFGLWSELERQGVPVLALRDNHRFHFYQNACLWDHAANPGVCALPRSVFADEYPLLTANPPGNVYPVDFTDLYCNEETCPAAVNGIPVFYDKHHFTRSFQSHISNLALDRLQTALDRAMLDKAAPGDSDRSRSAGTAP